MALEGLDTRLPPHKSVIKNMNVSDFQTKEFLLNNWFILSF